MNENASRQGLTLADALRLVDEDNMKDRVSMQKAYNDGFYDWQSRAKQLEVFLTSLLSKGNANK